jgi:probable rRNA maturation factor
MIFVVKSKKLSKQKNRTNKTTIITSRRWQVLLSVSVKKLFITEPDLVLLSKKILKKVELLCHRSYLPPKGVTTLSLVICSDKEIRKLNKFYRYKDKATDVLSFSQIEGEARGSGGQILGDIVISSETLKRQAIEYGVTNYEELCRLLVHGILHLCGYDHEKVSKNEKLKMEKLEDTILSLL